MTTSQIEEMHSASESIDSTPLSSDRSEESVCIALLTGGSDRPYVFGLVNELLSKNVNIDLIGSDFLDFPEFRNGEGVRFLNLRGNMDPDATLAEKISRVLRYYARLICYAAGAKPRIFHVLWNNKFEHFDRTLLMLYYRVLGKRLVLTAHNVNAQKRDRSDSFLNRLTLQIQYKLCNKIFVHTERMKQELVEDFGIWTERVKVIPFGINNAVPNTTLTSTEAKERLGLQEAEKVILFFGRITPYKGLEYLIDAIRSLSSRSKGYRLIIAGRPDRCEEYWAARSKEIRDMVESRQIILRADFIPDEDTEIYFKAADVLALPYRQIYQSGVLFLAHSFGLPVLATDVGSLKDDIVEGRTGFLVKPEDASNLARVIQEYFGSDLYQNLNARRQDIRAFAIERHSWDVVGQITRTVYQSLLQRAPSERSTDPDTAPAQEA
jgi:glycosyltransferase involved in cell wall biosynthesis